MRENGYSYCFECDKVLYFDTLQEHREKIHHIDHALADSLSLNADIDMEEKNPPQE